MPPKGHSKKSGGYYGEESDKAAQALRDLLDPRGTGPTSKFGPTLVKPPKKKKTTTYTGPTVTPVKPIKKKTTTTAVVEPKKKKPLTLEQYLRGDVDYQQQLRNLNMTAAQFLSEITRQKGKVEGEFGTSKKKLETQRGRDLTGLKEDFSGRGLLFSGLYGGKVGEYEQDYQTALGDLTRQRGNLLGDISSEQQRYNMEKKLTEEQARREAIRRRAAKAGK